MLNSIFHNYSFNLQAVLFAFLIAIVLGIYIAYIAKDIILSRDLKIVIAILPLLVSAVIMIVNGNFGASVAVLGAFGLVRFRSAPGTSKEIALIFFTMTIGLAIGMGFISLALIITFIVSALIFVLEKSNFMKSEQQSSNLRITIPEDLDYNGVFDDILDKYSSSYELERVKTTNMGTMFELRYLITLKDHKQQKAMIDELRCRNGNLQITLAKVTRNRNEF